MTTALLQRFPLSAHAALCCVVSSILGMGTGAIIAIAIAIVSGCSVAHPLSTHKISVQLNGSATRVPRALPTLLSLKTVVFEGSAARWSALGATLLQLGLGRPGIFALRRALDNESDNSVLRVALGEAIVMTDGGKVADSARTEFERVLRGDPNDLIARYYMAHWLLQNGKPKAALVKLVGLMRTVGNDPVWYASLWQIMPQAAEQAGVDRLALEALCVAGM